MVDKTSLAEQPITALWDAIATKSASRYHTLKTTPQQTAEGYTLTSPLLDEDKYYKLSTQEQLELFYLQRTSTNRSYPLPIFPMMEVEFEPGASCILQEDEGIFALGHQGTLDFFSPQMRYPFKMKASYFKHFRLKGKVNQWSVKISLAIKHPIEKSEHFDRQEQRFELQAGESFDISPRDYQNLIPKDPLQSEFSITIKTTSKEHSQVEYHFEFENNQE